MNTVELNEKITEYFEYIKTVYINEFEKYMDKSVKADILNMKCNVELRDELPYKVHVHDDSISFNLDLERFIKENNLEDEKSLNDLSEESKKYVNYLLKNKDNVFEVIKNKLLESFILLFTKNRKDVVTIGTSKLISKRLSKKYNLPNEDNIYITNGKEYYSKEEKVALIVADIVGMDILLCGIISRNKNVISSNFDIYSKIQNYDTFVNELNTTYEKYCKNKSKLYLTDSLYEYEKLDYKIDRFIENVREERHLDKENKQKRLISIQRSIINMINHKFLYSALEQRELERAYNNIKSILTNITGESGNLIDKEYDKILSIEKSVSKLIMPMWNNYLTNIKNNNPNYNYLISTKIDDDIIEAKLLSSDMLDKINIMDIKYGFICYPKDGAIINTSSKHIEYNKDSNGYNFKNKSESLLQAPNMIVASNIKKNNFGNEVLLDKNKTYIRGVYCYVDKELDNCPNYLKACVLSEDNELPLIILNKNELIDEKEQVKVA